MERGRSEQLDKLVRNLSTQEIRKIAADLKLRREQRVWFNGREKRERRNLRVDNAVVKLQQDVLRSSQTIARLQSMWERAEASSQIQERLLEQIWAVARRAVEAGNLSTDTLQAVLKYVASEKDPENLRAAVDRLITYSRSIGERQTSANSLKLLSNEIEDAILLSTYSVTHI